jgi:D-alanyl-D-alanine carboxypeptidase
MARLLTSTLSQASSGSKISSVFTENGSRVADTSDDGEGAPVLAALPIPAPTRVAEAPVARPQPAPTEEPMAMMSATSAPLAIAPTMVSYRPRIAASDIVPIRPPEREERRSAQSGAAVAMARAVLLPDSGRPMPPMPTPAPMTRMASIAPVAIPAQAPAPRPVKTVSLASATISAREVEATTGTLPRRRAEDQIPIARGTPHRAGWLVQIGAYDSEKAARAALDKAKSKSGSSLGRVDAFTEPVGGGSGRLWRARFAGFSDQKGADAACKALKRKDFACLALRQ